MHNHCVHVWKYQRRNEWKEMYWQSSKWNIEILGVFRELNIKISFGFCSTLNSKKWVKLCAVQFKTRQIKNKLLKKFHSSLTFFSRENCIMGGKKSNIQRLHGLKKSYFFVVQYFILDLVRRRKDSEWEYDSLLLAHSIWLIHSNSFIKKLCHCVKKVKNHSSVFPFVCLSICLSFY